MRNLVFVFATLLALSLVSAAASSSVPVRPGSIMKISIVDAQTGAFVEGKLVVAIEYSSPNQDRNYNYESSVLKPADEINLMMPPADYAATAKIRAKADGYEGGDELFITSQQYWASVLGTTTKEVKMWNEEALQASWEQTPEPPPAAKAPYLVEHTFRLKKVVEPVPPGPLPPGPEIFPPSPCVCLPFFVLTILSAAVISRRA